MNVKKFIVLLTIVFLICCPIVSGLTETGEFDTETYTQFLATTLGSGYGFTNVISPITLKTNQIAALNGLDYVSLEHCGISKDVGSPSYAYTTFTSQYGDGIIGYNFLYNDLGAEIGNYLFIQFSTPIQTTDTGAKEITLTYNNNEIYNVSFTSSTKYGGTTYGSQYMMGLGNAANPQPERIAGTYDGAAQKLYNNINRKFKHTYEVNLNENTNVVTGSITKTVSGVAYISKTFVKDYTNTIVSSEPNLNSATYNFMSTKSPIKLEIIDAYGSWHNTSLLLQPKILYNYTFDPTTTYPNESIKVVWSSNEAGTQLSNVKYVSMHMQSDYNSGAKLTARDGSNRWYNFLKFENGTWFQYDGNGIGGYTINQGTTFPNSKNIEFPASGNWTITTTIEDVTGEQQTETKYYNVLGNIGQLSLTIYPVDGIDGSLVTGSSVNVLNTETNIWTNRTITDFSDCQFPVNIGFYKFIVYAPVGGAYKNINQGNVEGVFVTTENIFKSVTLFPLTEGEISGDITNSTVFIGVRESEQLKPIYGATVSISPSGKIAKTNSVGIATFQLTNGTAYKATATASGYQTTAVTFTPNTATYSFDIAMGSGGAVPTGYGYLTPAPMPTATLAPVITPAKWANGTATTCQVTMPANSTPIQRLMNSAACMGIEGPQEQSLALAGLIIMVFLAAGAKYGKGIGAAVGSVIGFILSLAAGLIPTWVFFALLCILGLVVAIYALNR